MHKGQVCPFHSYYTAKGYLILSVLADGSIYILGNKQFSEQEVGSSLDNHYLLGFSRET
jgi:hypothetical protein